MLVFYYFLKFSLDRIFSSLYIWHMHKNPFDLPIEYSPEEKTHEA